MIFNGKQGEVCIYGSYSELSKRNFDVSQLFDPDKKDEFDVDGRNHSSQTIP